MSTPAKNTMPVRRIMGAEMPSMPMVRVMFSGEVSQTQLRSNWVLATS